MPAFEWRAPGDQETAERALTRAKEVVDLSLLAKRGRAADVSGEADPLCRSPISVAVLTATPSSRRQNHNNRLPWNAHCGRGSSARKVAGSLSLAPLALRSVRASSSAS
jgi:hypothetical protein